MDSDVAMVPTGDSSSLPGPSSSSKKPKRFEIKKWNAVALWAWDIVVDNCAICRNHIMDLCIECQANQASATCLGYKGVAVVLFRLVQVAGEEPNPCWWKGPREVFKSVVLFLLYGLKHVFNVTSCYSKYSNTYHIQFCSVLFYTYSHKAKPLIQFCSVLFTH
ncbi:putative Zinc finger, RING/FYVE/PHD-type, anaphase-promoting complex subunit 11 [Helianthus anomalus]